MILVSLKLPNKSKSRMRRRFCPAKRTIGAIGPFAVAGIACTFGRMQRLWNFPTVRTGGFVSYSMENWPRCTPADLRKVELIPLVSVDFDPRSQQTRNCSFSIFKDCTTKNYYFLNSLWTQNETFVLFFGDEQNCIWNLFQFQQETFHSIYLHSAFLLVS